MRALQAIEESLVTRGKGLLSSSIFLVIMGEDPSGGILNLVNNAEGPSDKRIIQSQWGGNMLFLPSPSIALNCRLSLWSVNILVLLLPTNGVAGVTAEAISTSCP